MGGAARAAVPAAPGAGLLPLSSPQGARPIEARHAWGLHAHPLRRYTAGFPVRGPAARPPTPILRMARSEHGGEPSATLPPGTRVAAVVSGYHREVTGGMFRSAARTLIEAGLEAEHLLEVSVPGAFEIPLVARRLAERDDVDGVLCFGLVLKGETEHDRHIAGAVAEGLMRVGLETGKPVLFGVLTCSTMEQAERRARPREQGGLDKGHEVARAFVEVRQALERAAHGFRAEALPHTR